MPTKLEASKLPPAHQLRPLLCIFSFVTPLRKEEQFEICPFLLSHHKPRSYHRRINCYHSCTYFLCHTSSAKKSTSASKLPPAHKLRPHLVHFSLVTPLRKEEQWGFCTKGGTSTHTTHKLRPFLYLFSFVTPAPQRRATWGLSHTPGERGTGKGRDCREGRGLRTGDWQGIGTEDERMAGNGEGGMRTEIGIWGLRCKGMGTSVGRGRQGGGNGARKWQILFACDTQAGGWSGELETGAGIGRGIPAGGKGLRSASGAGWHGRRGRRLFFRWGRQRLKRDVEMGREGSKGTALPVWEGRWPVFNYTNEIDSVSSA